MKFETFKPDIKEIDTTLTKPTMVSDLFGMVQTVTAAPTGNPTKLIDQIKIYNNAGTRKLMIYDTAVGTWYGVTIT